MQLILLDPHAAEMGFAPRSLEPPGPHLCQNLRSTSRHCNDCTRVLLDRASMRSTKRSSLSTSPLREWRRALQRSGGRLCVQNVANTSLFDDDPRLCQKDIWVSGGMEGAFG